MPLRTIVFWRDIPTMVMVKAGRQTAKRQLPERFEQAVDMAAMRAGQKDTDAYLSQMRRGEPEELQGSDLEAIAEAESQRLQAEFDQERLKTMIAQGGWATPRD